MNPLPLGLVFAIGLSATVVSPLAAQSSASSSSPPSAQGILVPPAPPAGVLPEPAVDEALPFLVKRPNPVIGPVPSPSPRDDVSPPPPSPPAGTDIRPSATFTFADARRIKTRSRTGRFRLVGLHPNETVDIALQFPAVLLSSSATAQSLDGGKIISFSRNPVGAGGLAVIRFQAGSQPGLYRVLLPGLGAPALLQFWVPDPNNPSATRPGLLNRNH